MRLRLWAQIAPIRQKSARQPPADERMLDLSADAFTGDERWLEIAVSRRHRLHESRPPGAHGDPLRPLRAERLLERVRDVPPGFAIAIGAYALSGGF
jgi:hypothetical protein